MMTTVYEVPPEKLIERVAEKLKEKPELKEPEKLKFIKSGVHREKAPEQQDWWYTRAAAILRKVYLKHRIGVSRLAAGFGGAQDRGTKPDRAKKGGRAIVRELLKQLEQAGYIIHVKGEGRSISAAGRAFLDSAAHEVMQELIKLKPELAKY